MQNYIGYGFDTNDITKKELVEFARKYDSDLSELTDDEILAEIDMNSMNRSEYVRNVINGTEEVDVVTSYDNFLVFDSIDFVDNCSARAKRIPSQASFVVMISKYFPTDNITFGNLYEGSDWDDPTYMLD